MKRINPRRLIHSVILITLFVGYGTGLKAAELHGSLMATSSYFWRGYSKSDHHVSGQVNLDFTWIEEDSGYYLGAWLSSIDFGSQNPGSAAEYELTLYGGWSQRLTEDFTVDLQASHYIYDDRLFDLNADYSELYVFLHYRDLLTAEVAYAPDAYSLGSATVNGQLTLRYPLHRYIDFSAGSGYFAARDVFIYDYRYWNAGVTWKANRFSLDIRHFSARFTNKRTFASPYSAYRYYQANYHSLPYTSSATVVTLATGF